MAINNEFEYDQSRVKEYEQFLLRIPGIFSVKIVAEGNELEEIHILSDTTRSAKQINRDIQSVFLAHFGIQIPHQIISIARVEMGETVMDGEAPVRLLFESLSVQTGIRADCTVTLLRDQESFEGTHSDVNVPSMRPRLIATATLNAVGVATQNARHYSLTEVQPTNIGGKKAFCVMVSNNTARGEHLLIGCALVRGSEDETVIRATLDAVNRQLHSSAY